MGKTGRDVGVDLYRTVLMFSICLLHTIGVNWCGDGLNSTRVAALFDFSTVGFVMISGYYGIRFKPSKVLNLMVIGFFSAIVSVIVGSLVLDGCVCVCFCQTVYRVYCAYWFLHAYVFLMLVAPVVNYAVERCKTLHEFLGFTIPIFFLIYVWSFWRTVDLKAITVPITDGFSPASGLTLLGSYIVGRMYGKFNMDSLISRSHPIILFVILAVLSFFGCARNNSAVNVLMALISFYWFRKLVFQRGAHFLALMKPSIFPIYLITTNVYGFTLLSHSRVWFASHSVWLPLSWFVLTVVFFVSGLFLDIPRRVLAPVLRAPCKAVCDCVDSWYERLLKIGEMRCRD